MHHWTFKLVAAGTTTGGHGRTACRQREPLPSRSAPADTIGSGLYSAVPFANATRRYGLVVVVVVIVVAGPSPLFQVVVVCFCVVPSEEVVVFLCTTAPLPQLVVVLWLDATDGSAGATMTGGATWTTGGGTSTTGAGATTAGVATWTTDGGTSTTGAGAGTVSTSLVLEKHPYSSAPAAIEIASARAPMFVRIAFTCLDRIP